MVSYLVGRLEQQPKVYFNEEYEAEAIIETLQVSASLKEFNKAEEDKKESLLATPFEKDPQHMKMLSKYYFQQVHFTKEVYRYLVVCADFLVCLSHGSNDVGNAISPLLILMRKDGYNDKISFFLGSMGIAVGLFTMGMNVMKTMGKDIVYLDFMKGFSSQFSCAICVTFGSSLGLPLSTTHCMVGSLAGLYIAGKSKGMQSVYKRVQVTDGEEHDGPQSEESKLNFGTLKKIFFYWMITVPCAMVVSIALTKSFMVLGFTD